MGSIAKSKWPCVSILLNDKEIFIDCIREEQTLKFKLITSEKFSITIRYQDKDDFDTVVDENGNIIENQSVEIKKIIINQIDLIKTGLIYKNIGNYKMNLSDYKKLELKKYNQSTDLSTNLLMCENGDWTIILEQPLYTFLSKLWYRSEPAEIVNIPSIKKEIRTITERCLKIQSD